MNSFLAPQIDFLLAIQNFRELTGGILDNFFMFITLLGEITWPVMVMSLIYWCINSKNGMYLFWNWCFGVITFQFFKVFACIYRPWYLDARIKPLPEAMGMAGGYSFPSGHTQTAIAIWGGIAYTYKKNKLLFNSLIILITLIAFSRMYIGVHTPQDVLFSIFTGIILLFVTQKLMEWVDNGKNRDIYILFSVLGITLALLIYTYFKSYPMDYINGELLFDPARMKVVTFAKTGLIFGTFIGWFSTRRLLNFDGSQGTVKEKFIRFIVGASALLIISFFFKPFLVNSFDERIALFLTSFFSSFFVTFLYPAIIVRYRKTFINK